MDIEDRRSCIALHFVDEPGIDMMVAQAPTENFEAFFQRHEPRITGYLWRMTCNEQLALDLSQETFVRAWQHFATIQTYPQPAAWLFRVATNLALHEIRRRASPVGAAMPFDDANDPAYSDPGRRFAERDLVRQTLLELSLKQRALLVLREVYGLSFEEIAATLDLAPDATRMAVSRARQQFRQVYLRKEQDHA